MVYRILCATDGSQHSKHAVTYSAELAKLMGADLTIAAVNVAMGGMRGPVLYGWDDSQAKQLLDQAADEARKADASAKTTMLKGREASTAIVQYAEAEKFDQIVIGTGDKKGVSRLFLGSVAADVTRRAHCTVTVAR